MALDIYQALKDTQYLLLGCIQLVWLCTRGIHSECIINTLTKVFWLTYSLDVLQFEGNVNLTRVLPNPPPQSLTFKGKMTTSLKFKEKATELDTRSYKCLLLALVKLIHGDPKLMLHVSTLEQSCPNDALETTVIYYFNYDKILH